LAVKAPLLAPVFTWTGCYLGVNGGWIGSQEEYTTRRSLLGPAFADPNTVAGGDGVPAGAAPPSAVNLLTHSYNGKGSDGTAGGQFGCQYQWGAWVLGGEWDFNWSGLKETNSFNFPLTVDPATGFTWYPRNEFVHKQLDWFSTARVRLGWAIWDRVLIYGTGGLAIAGFDSFTQVAFITPASPLGNPQYFGDYSKQRIGWTAGGGLEWAFANNWTVKAEFLYLDLGTFDYISPRTSFNINTDTRVWVTHIDAKEYVARVGLNYLFHLGPAVPVVAAY
jgi:outer membrane immunogenic protein